MIVIEFGEGVEPDEAEHRREQVEADEIPETEAGEDKEQRDGGKSQHGSDRVIEPSGVVQHVGLPIRDLCQRSAADDDMKANQCTQAEARVGCQPNASQNRWSAPAF